MLSRIREFRGSRPANAIAMLLFFIGGSYILVTETGMIALVLGIFFVVVALLGTFKLLFGEPITALVSSESQ
ncbi:hypothetical protein [Halospeciosus flavus]|uniref:hypothetical protein n=1 Tax=Halospeciosus flavus TaxID=3032283 RepID=UPI00360B8101